MESPAKVDAADMKGDDALLMGRNTNFVIRRNNSCKIVGFLTRNNVTNSPTHAPFTIKN
jgi:hypothetical protein